MTDITELAQSLKRRATSANEFGESLYVKADDVLALVEALEKEQKRIAELESRTVNVKLPTTIEPTAFSPWVAKAFYQFHKDTVKSCFAVFSDACAAAGIKVEQLS
ncbi:hypothetical protein RJ629_10295 [Klebsiella quasipneumoniae]|uniref:hypothetical protein n=1 Tax=Klebsiella quasipneumoniae TaxID=1463165 RepID=UPI002874432F|nr:hypothetical protein [Klebsiella quasipneumoniae]MDS1018752.1 hypothetical protein [Klebsiella quasipneumoniae]